MVTRHGEPRSEAAAVEPRPAAPVPRESRWTATRGTAALYAAVMLGTVIGGVLRALISTAANAPMEYAFPWGTLFVNVTGSFLIGFYATLTGPDGRLFAGPKQRHFVMTGICGGYTTFSIFSLETLRLLQDLRPLAAAANVGLSVASWLLAVWLGHIAAAGINRLKGL